MLSCRLAACPSSLPQLELYMYRGGRLLLRQACHRLHAQQRFLDWAGSTAWLLAWQTNQPRLSTVPCDDQPISGADHLAWWPRQLSVEQRSVPPPERDVLWPGETFKDDRGVAVHRGCGRAHMHATMQEDGVQLLRCPSLNNSFHPSTY